MSKVHLPGAHLRAQVTEGGAAHSPPRHDHGAARRAVTNWQSRGRRGSLRSPVVVARDDRR
jgi:hypothetical protein